jgi:hypothetical protein
LPYLRRPEFGPPMHQASPSRPRLSPEHTVAPESARNTVAPDQPRDSKQAVQGKLKTLRPCVTELSLFSRSNPFLSEVRFSSLNEGQVMHRY